MFDFRVRFGVHFGTRSDAEGPRLAQEGHQEPQRTEKPRVLEVFGCQRPFKTVSEGARRLSRGTCRATRPQRKADQKWTRFVLLFGAILGTILGSKVVQKVVQKKDKNWTLKKVDLGGLPPAGIGPGSTLFLKMQVLGGL